MPKVMVVIPEDLLSDVDGAARASLTNRSAFICRSPQSQLRSERLRQLRRRILDDLYPIFPQFFRNLYRPLVGLHCLPV